MLKLLRRMAVSFSLYSRIPMPRFAWDEEDMKYSMLFFPLVGFVIGGAILGINCIPGVPELPLSVRSAVTVLIPILITGGFHLDGFMDTEDALRSYQSKEKKLEIMKDPHTGAFAVIGLAACLLAMSAATGTILTYGSRWTWGVLGLIYAAGRAYGGISALLLPGAKKDGMLAEETRGEKRNLLTVLLLWLALATVMMIAADTWAGIAVTVCFLLCMVRYGRMTKREFGGVTGDTTGYFITCSETAACIVLALVVWLSRRG